jgi:1-phosphofructokinase/tagatose 6-phosphate kinase
VILCVAGNPSIDKLFEVEHLKLGEIHRPEAFVALAGGKGLHVAQVGHLLGAQAAVTGLLGGYTGRWVAEQMTAQGIDCRFAWTTGETRSSLSVADRATGQLTEFYEAGAPVSEAEWAQVEQIARAAFADASWVALAGSLPPGAPPAGYARLITAARDAGVRTAVDARGSALLAAISARPDLVKINGHEAAELLGTSVADVPGALAAARRVRDALGGEGHSAAVTVTEGVGLVGPDGAGWIATVPAQGRYPVGSGDSFMAGLLVALERGDPWPDAACLALGAAAANAEVPGAASLDPDRALALAAQVNCAEHPPS